MPHPCRCVIPLPDLARSYCFGTPHDYDLIGCSDSVSSLCMWNPTDIHRCPDNHPDPSLTPPDCEGFRLRAGLSGFRSSWGSLWSPCEVAIYL